MTRTAEESHNNIDRQCKQIKATAEYLLRNENLPFGVSSSLRTIILKIDVIKGDAGNIKSQDKSKQNPLTELQRQAIRNACYGLTFMEAIHVLHKGSDRLKREQWMEAITDYFTEELECFRFVEDIIEDIDDIENKKWLEAAILSHTHNAHRDVEFSIIQSIVNYICGW